MRKRRNAIKYIPVTYANGTVTNDVVYQLTNTGDQVGVNWSTNGTFAGTAPDMSRVLLLAPAGTYLLHVIPESGENHEFQFTIRPNIWINLAKYNCKAIKFSGIPAGSIAIGY